MLRRHHRRGEWVLEIRRTPPALTTFELYRAKDESGVSGTGKVLEGFVFSDGTVTVRWCTKDAPTSTVVYATWQDFLDIHVLSHHNNVTIRMINPLYEDWAEWTQIVPFEEQRVKLVERLKKDLAELISLEQD